MTNEQLVMNIKAEINVSVNMEQLWQQNHRFIHTIAMKYLGYAEIEDLEQEGYLALYDAVNGFNPEAGFRFLSYAEHWIRQRMVRYIQNNGCIRIPVNEVERIWKYRKLEREFLLQTGHKPSDKEIACHMGISLKQVSKLKESLGIRNLDSLDKYLQEDGETTVGDMVPGNEDVEGAVLDKEEENELRKLIWVEVDTLPGRQPEVIRARYQRKETLHTIGENIGVSIENVRQIEKKALRELRRPCHSRKLRAFLPEVEESQVYRHNGVEEFNRTWTSSTEWVALRL